MNQKDFGNNYSLESTVRFFRSHWILLTVVFLVALAVSVVASFMVTTRYKSSAILFPTNSMRVSKAILAERYSMDFLDYGSERDCEYAIQILSSQSMEDAVCKRFNLLEHYAIKPDDPQKLFKLHGQYTGNVSVKRTEFLGVEISVLDVDPQMAADIANFMAVNYDSLSSRIQKDRASDAYKVMQQVCQQMESDLNDLVNQWKADKTNLGLNELISFKSKELAELQTRMAETKVDMDQQVSYKFWLDKAAPADKKAYPKRAIIVLLGSFGTLIVCILLLLVTDRLRLAKSK